MVSDGTRFDTPSSATPRTSLAGRAFGLAMRRVKGARKQALGGGKVAEYPFRRFKPAEMSLYFRLRDSETGRVLLRAASMARSPREIRHRPRAAAPHPPQPDQTTQPCIDPRTGYSLLSLSPKGEFGNVLATSRQLFEFKKEDIDETLS